MAADAIDDSEIVCQVRGGDRDAYASLVRTYETRVRGYCRSMLRNAAEAEDAAQDIFLKAYEALPGFRMDATFSTWLFRIAVNHCRDLLRKAARQRTESWDTLRERAGEQIERLMATPDPGPLTAAQRAVIRHALGSLSEPHRVILVLRELQGLTYEELAATLDCSLDAVKGRLKRARQELEKKLRHIFGPSRVTTDGGRS